ncbi:MAG: phosphotransferase [Myxococcota bacterium]
MHPALPSQPIPSQVEHLTPEWVTSALRAGGFLDTARVARIEREILGQGEGFIGTIVRLRITLDRPERAAPKTLIAKLPISIAQNRTLGEMGGTYEREIRFYQALARDVGIRTPRCYYAAMDPNPAEGHERQIVSFLERLPLWLCRLLMSFFFWISRRSPRRYILLLEDLAPARVGNQVEGCSAREAECAVRALARMHARQWNNPALEDLHWVAPIDTLSRFFHAMFLRAHGRFLEQFGPVFSPTLPDLAAWLERHALSLVRSLASLPRTLLHGDYRLDNLFFHEGPEGPEVIALDWQVVALGPGELDLAYFITGNVRVHEAAGCERDLVRAYYEELRTHGVERHDWAACERAYALSKVFVLYRMMSGLDLLDFYDARGQALVEGWIARLSKLLPHDWAALLADAPGRPDALSTRGRVSQGSACRPPLSSGSDGGAGR